ncbi:MAG TPA: hypothetical protein VF185_00380 [Patescibacteria group bacterium]
MVELMSLKPNPIECKTCQLLGGVASPCTLVEFLTEQEEGIRLTTPQRRKLLREIGEALEETRKNCKSMCFVNDGGINPKNNQCERLKNMIDVRLKANF